MNRLLFCIVIALAYWSPWTEAQGFYAQNKLVRLEPITNGHLQYLQALERNGTLDFWTEAVGPNQPVDVHIERDEFDHYVSEFKQISLPFTVIVDDLQKIIDEERQDIEREKFMRQLKGRVMGDTRADIVGTYASYDEMVAFMEEKANADPTHVQVISIGQTTQKRDTKGIVLKFNSAATRNIWIDCGIHAREWITPATCIYHIDQYIKDYSTDASIRALLDYWNVYIIPSLNPDGYEYSRTPPGRMWRKSRNVNPGSTCIGVDLNRNFPNQWMTGGASNSPCSETFAGRSAGSEIETQNIVNFITSKKGTWDLYMSFHSYGQWWFTPYGYSTNYPNNYNTLLRLADEGAAAIKPFNNRAYVTGTVSRVLYIASGSTVDWAFDELDIPFSYTIELPPTQRESSTGFVLPPALAPGVCLETYAGMKVFLQGLKKEVDGTSSG